jgi:murein DD-endopeptidase MepM/ murein hydrolase activator NlpD
MLMLSVFAVQSVILAPPANARLSDDQRKALQSGIRYYNTEIDACVTAISTGTGGTPEAGNTFVAWNSGLQAPYIMEQYVIEVLKYIADFKKVPRDDVVTEQHVQALLAFALGEGGDIANSSTFNLFNTSALRNDPEAMPYAAGGVDGRLAYANFDVGIKATGGTMLLPRYTRLIDVLLVKDSTAEEVLYNYTHYSQFPGNGWWAQQNEIDGEAGYYQYELNLLGQVRSRYAEIASLGIGTPARELRDGTRYPEKLVYQGGGESNPVQGGGGGGTTPSCECSAGGSGPVDSSSPVIESFSFYVSKGLSREQAAGFVGNLMIESGDDIDPTIVSASGTYHGIVQWGDSAASGRRWQKLLEWADANSKDPMTRITQLEFSWVELTTDYPRTYEKLKQETTAAGAAKLILDEYEGARGQKEAERIEKAEFVLRTAPAAVGSGSSPTCNATGEGGVAVVDGFAFPLRTTKTVVRAGIDGLIWCSTSQTNCHHNYNAADIGVPVGTAVVAAKEGNIVMARNSASQCGSSVVILGSDNHVYYYTHMLNGSVGVQAGQSVAAGAELGQVGDKACGTPPHLHFDMQPPPARNRPSCSGAGCRSVNFLEVQPALTKSFEALPE